NPGSDAILLRDEEKMKMMLPSWARLMVMLPFAFWAASVQAHDVDAPFAGAQPTWNAARSSYMPTDRSAASVMHPATSGFPHAPQFIVVLPNRWAVGQNLRICFYAGDPALQKRILDTASVWLNFSSLRFVL